MAIRIAKCKDGKDKKHNGISVCERSIDRTELYSVDVKLFCGSAMEITPIFSIDRYEIGNGNIGFFDKEASSFLP